MKLADKIPLLFIALIAGLVIYSSCANQGMPTGGLKDTIPPVLIGTLPEYKGLNYKGEEVRLTFSEYIIHDKVTDVLIVSPPLSKRPTIRTKSKTLIVGFNEELKGNTTYSLDFKNAIVDNNESNPLNDLRFLFSTGDKIDSFRIAGMVRNSFNLEPVENALVFLHQNLHDSAAYRVVPDYVAKTNQKGIFYFDNLRPATFHLFAINDANTNLMYEEGAEEIAFLDSVIIPSAEYHEKLDTLAKDADSLLILGHTHFKPDPVYLLQFGEDIFEQYLRTYKRLTRSQLIFGFNESVADTFAINLPEENVKNWYAMEQNSRKDSIIMWLTDSTLIRKDTLVTELVYYQLDSLKNIFLKRDTLNLTFTGKEEEPKTRRKPKEDEKKIVPQFDIIMEFASMNIDLNDSVQLIATEPITHVNQNMIHLYQIVDSIQTPLKFSLVKDTTSLRQYKLYYPWESNSKYMIKIDSAAMTNLYGLTSRTLKKDFISQKEDYYGKIILNLKEVSGSILIQLLSNNEEEKVLKQKITVKNETVKFDFLKPEKYRLKIIFDRNKNGKWDPGSYQDKIQPEKVTYWNEVVKVRSNWDSALDWVLKPDSTYSKKMYDKELEEQKLKELQKKRQEEEKKRRKGEPIQTGNEGEGMGIPNPMRIGR